MNSLAGLKRALEAAGKTAEAAEPGKQIQDLKQE
jgi:hypothetical protein